jgi:Kef-type K+ transport system membrane component KefB
LAAKFIGQNWHDSLTIGALMNTRGLMEPIVLNIGLELNVLTPEVFTMMCYGTSYNFYDWTSFEFNWLYF